MTIHKKISVAMTTYNGEKYIKKQIESILNQSLKVDEIIICDDCSSDNTLSIVNNYPVKIIKNKTQLGFKSNFKKAIKNCSGDYIFLCDQDDIWNTFKVEKMISIINSNPNIQVLASSFDYIDSNDKVIKINEKKNYSNNNLYPHKVQKNQLVNISFDDLILANFFQGCSLVMTKNMKDYYINHFDNSIPHDWLLNLYASVNNSLYFYNDSLFYYRIHSNNTLGIPDVNETATHHAKRSNNINIRLQQIRDTLNAIYIIKENMPRYYYKRQEYFEDFLSFLTKHIEYVEQKKVFHLILQNNNIWYRRIKSWRARLMDIIYVITH